MPTIEPLKEPGYEYPQSKTEILPKLPIRALVLSPGSGGKTTMITRLLVDKQFYGGKFSRIYWFSPSATVDDALDPLRDYVKKIKIRKMIQVSTTNSTQILLRSCLKGRRKLQNISRRKVLRSVSIFVSVSMITRTTPLQCIERVVFWKPFMSERDILECQRL